MVGPWNTSRPSSQSENPPQSPLTNRAASNTVLGDKVNCMLSEQQAGVEIAATEPLDPPPTTPARLPPRHQVPDVHQPLQQHQQRRRPRLPPPRRPHPNNPRNAIVVARCTTTKLTNTSHTTVRCASPWATQDTTVRKQPGPRLRAWWQWFRTVFFPPHLPTPIKAPPHHVHKFDYTALAPEAQQ